MTGFVSGLKAALVSSEKIPFPVCSKGVGCGIVLRMSKIEEIERAVEQLPLTDFVKLATWMDRRRQQLEGAPSSAATAIRNHSAFLNSYAQQDEGLYDDAAAG
jgi:hypothetical protein